MRVDGQEPGTRRERWTSGPLTAKSISIKDAKRRPGDRAWKATELTPGDLLCVAAATGSTVRRAGPVAELVGIEGGVVSGVINLESPGVEAPGRRPRHEECYQQA